MTQHQLRDLLHERVADETTVDLTRGAWRAGRQHRRRRSLAVGGGVVAGALAVSGAFAWIDTSPRPTGTPSAQASTSASPAATGAGPDATHQGVDVWWSPDQTEERELPYVDDGPFPHTLDLAVRTKALVGPARAAFATGDTVLLVGEQNSIVSIDVSRLDDVALPHGYRVAPTSSRMLSPGGTRLLFPQDRSIEVYTIATGAWSTIETDGEGEGDSNAYAVWVDDFHIGVLPRVDGGDGPRYTLGGRRSGGFASYAVPPSFATRQAVPYGDTEMTDYTAARSWGMGGIDLPHRGDSVSDPELISVETPDLSGVLAMTDVRTDGSDSRYKDCCPVVGWLDDQTVVYLSRQAEHTLVAWTVGTHEFRRVTTITGGSGDAQYDAASFAAFS